MSSPHKKQQLEHVLKMLDNSGITPADLLRYANTNGGDVVGHCKTQVKMRAERLKSSPLRIASAASVVKANGKSRVQAKKT